jgi:hypothetical protein
LQITIIIIYKIIGGGTREEKCGLNNLPKARKALTSNRLLSPMINIII